MSTQTPSTGTDSVHGAHTPGDDTPTTDRSDEPAWLLVTRREVVSRITDKSFLLGTAFMVVLIAGFIGFNAWQEERTETVTLAATPDSAAMATAIADAAPGVAARVTVSVRSSCHALNPMNPAISTTMNAVPRRNDLSVIRETTSRRVTSSQAGSSRLSVVAGSPLGVVPWMLSVPVLGVCVLMRWPPGRSR